MSTKTAFWVFLAFVLGLALGVWFERYRPIPSDDVELHVPTMTFHRR